MALQAENSKDALLKAAQLLQQPAQQRYILQLCRAENIRSEFSRAGEPEEILLYWGTGIKTTNFGVKLSTLMIQRISAQVINAETRMKSQNSMFCNNFSNFNPLFIRVLRLFHYLKLTSSFKIMYDLKRYIIYFIYPLCIIYF